MHRPAGNRHEPSAGMHAITFGGNPIAAAAGFAAVRMIEEEELLERGPLPG